MKFNVELFNKYGVDITTAFENPKLEGKAVGDLLLIALLDFLRATDYIIIKKYEQFLQGEETGGHEEVIVERKLVRTFINENYPDNIVAN